MNPLTSTLADLTAAKLIAYYPPPAPGAPIISGSSDPDVYRSADYIRQLNEQAYHKYAVDVPNQYEADRFAFRSKQWEMNGKSSILPAPPKYLAFDVTAFNQWWAQYVKITDISNYGSHDAPPLFFIKAALLPPDPVILNTAAQQPAAPPAIDGPIGSAVPNNPGVFNPSANDNCPDGYVYAGPTGIYQKHVYSNPFTAGNVRVIWIALQPLAA